MRATDDKHARGTRRGKIAVAIVNRHEAQPAHDTGALAGERRFGEPRARDGGGHLPHRVAARLRHADPPARRLRPRRGGAARRVPGGARAMAARRRSGQPARLAGLGRAASRPSTASAGARGSTRSRTSPSSRSGRRRDAAAVGRREHRGRSAAADLHLLPSRRSRRTRRSRSRCARSAA